MSKVNGKQKGNSFERHIANMLSERFESVTGVEKGFRRNPDSGSFFGGSNVHRTEIYDTDYALYGDLICPRNFKFSIECKNYKTAPPLNAILNQKVTQWDGWLKQATQDAETSGKEMMMIVKYNRTETMIFVDKYFTNSRSESEISGLRFGWPVFNYGMYSVWSADDLLDNSDHWFFTLEE